MVSHWSLSHFSQFWPVMLLYKKLFLRKKSSRPRAALDLDGVEEGEVISDCAAPKRDFFFFVKLLFDPQYKCRDRTDCTKASRKVSSLASSMERHKKKKEKRKN